MLAVGQKSVKDRHECVMGILEQDKIIWKITV